MRLVLASFGQFFGAIWSDHYAEKPYWNMAVIKVQKISIKLKWWILKGKPTLVKCEDSITQPDTEAKEDDNEHSEMNIEIKVIALQIIQLSISPPRSQGDLW